MLIDMLLMFIVLSIILFILALYTMEEEPMLAIPLIMVNLIIIVIITYGFWDVEYIAIGQVGGVYNTSIYSTTDYGTPYSYIFVLFFFIHCMLFVKVGFNLWREALETKGEMEYRRKYRR